MKFRIWQKSIHLAAILALGFMAVAAIESAAAEETSTIKFQGKIVNANGTNLTPGNPACVVAGAGNDDCDIRVSLYDASSGGNLKWQEVFAEVELESYAGVFTVHLNSKCLSWQNPVDGGACLGKPTLSGIDWSANPNLFVQVDFSPAGDETWTETFSRTKLTSVPYTYYSGDSARLDGIAKDGFVQIQPSGSSTTGSWVALAAPGVNIGAGGESVYDPVNHRIYTQVGNSTQTFMYYDIATNAWATVANVPAAVTTGGSIVYADGYIYAAVGGFSSSFYRYNIASNSWTAMASAPAGFNQVSTSMFWYKDTNKIYTKDGQTNVLRIYDIATNTWSSTSTAPQSLRGPAIRIGNYVYIPRLSTNRDMYRYDISGNSWTRLRDIDSVVTNIGSSWSAGTQLNSEEIIYVPFASPLQIARYNTRTDSWSLFSPGPPHTNVTANGSSMIHARDKLYAIGGGGGSPGVLYELNADFSQSVTSSSSQTIINIDYTGSAAPDLIDLKVDGSSAFRVVNNGDTYIKGKLGIGIQNPTQEVDVNGDIQLSGNILANSNLSYDTSFSFVGREVSGAGSAVAQDVAVDSNGDVYVAGYFNGTLDFGSGVGTWTSTNDDYFIIKYSKDGKVIWADRENSGTNVARAKSIATDNSGNVYALGSFVDTIDVGAGAWLSGTVSNNAYFLVKYSSTGTVIWADKSDYVAAGSTTGEGVAVDSLNNVYIGGVMSGTHNFGFGSVTHGSGFSDHYVMKYTPSGTPIWYASEVVAAGTNNTFPRNIAVDNADNVYIVGHFDGTTDFGAGSWTPTSGSGVPDYYIVKYNSAGVFQWADRENTSTGAASAYDVAADSQNNVYVTGRFNGGDADFGAGNWTPTGNDFFMVKYNSGGTFQWAKRETGSGSVNNNQYQGITVDELDRIYLASDISGTVDFGGGNLTAGGVTDYVVVSFDADGNFIWADTEDSGGGSATATAVAASGGKIFLSGYIATGTVDFGNGYNISATGNDYFIAGYSKSYTGSNIGTNTNPFANIYAGTYHGKELSINNFDVAEEYEVDDASINAGDVVRLKSENAGNVTLVERAGGDGNSYDGGVIGVVSTEPGLYLKDWEANKENGRPVALAGRVPVKVTAENGGIKRGDYLTTSSKPGYAMRASSSGLIIGRAMEDFDPGQKGDSELVEEELVVQEEEAVNAIEVLEEEGAITASEADEAQEVVDEVLGSEPTQENTGRIMMYVDLGYVGDSVYELNDQMNSAFAVKDFSLDNGNRLYELMSGENGVKLSFGGDVEVKGELKVNVIRSKDIEDIAIKLATGKGLRVVDNTQGLVLGINDKGRLSLREGVGSSLNSATITAGEKEVTISDSEVTENSRVFFLGAKSENFIATEFEAGKGFKIKTNLESVGDIEVNYLILN